MRSPSSLSLSILAGCATASAMPLASDSSGGTMPPAELPLSIALTTATPENAPAIAALRSQGQTGLDQLLARYDQTAPGPEKDQLALTVDQVAAQRYATVSRLYWYTDLDAAEQVAHRTGRPILALRMLGRLDEELSCANSRFFRATLYSNTEVSKYLRDHYVLYWSSERPVPKVTIEFGDGRKLVRTTTGNSAHYILDDTGRVLDVLPGLYAPSVFKSELETIEKLAAQVKPLAGEKRIAALHEYQGARVRETEARMKPILGLMYLPGRTTLLGTGDIQRAVSLAQRVTMSKARIEVPDLQQIGIIGTEQAIDDRAAWATIGQAMWNIGTFERVKQEDQFAFARTDETDPKARTKSQTKAQVKPAQVLDASSRALVISIFNGEGSKASETYLDSVLARLEQSIVADTAINELRLRGQIRNHLYQAGEEDFARLNEWIYTNVFMTPKSDPWLNLLPRTEFSGLPGDGVVMN